MDSSYLPVFITMAIVIGLAIRLASDRIDRNRIAAYLGEKGGAVLSTRWTPFGTGWYGSQNERIYRVAYLDRDGNEHHATCKTSLFSGVYFTEDEIVRLADPVDPPDPPAIPGATPPAPSPEERLARLEEENRRLREQLARQNGE